MRKWLYASLAMFMLAGCQTGPSVVEDKHTGQKIAVSSSANAYTGMMDWLKVRAFHSNKNGYGVETMYSNYGWIFPQEVWSYGRKFPYASTNSQTTMCGGAGGCITLESGVVAFTKEEFEKASQSGFEFKLVGKNGAVEGKIPAKLFLEVLAKSNI